FRAVLFRMVPKQHTIKQVITFGFRAVLFRMVPKQGQTARILPQVLELCCFEWFQNVVATKYEYNKPPPSFSLGGVIYVGHRFAMS
ncbi:hypothetical protein, partial [Streptococcus equinus]|uniref:hypothetical protein n=1 Tax=Streptococcus equinus TaxID=1335 RepID=UPI001F24A927